MSMLKAHKSDYFLVVGERHGRTVSSMGVERCVKDIKGVFDTMEEAEVAVRQNNDPVKWDGGIIESEEKYMITQESYY